MKKVLLVASILFLTLVTNAQVSITVNVPNAGGFSAALTAAGGDVNTVTDLKVTGNINAVDIQFMNSSLPLLAVLDLEAVQIVANGSNPANKFPDNAFSYNTHLTNIKLPNDITIIGMSAFNNCIGLKCNITIPSKVKEIYVTAFQKCSGLTGNLVIPNSVTTIRSYAFADCIGFTGNLIIPNSVTWLGNDVFSGCRGFNGDLIIPNSITIIRSNTFSWCDGLKGSLTIPSSVTSIEMNAFSVCSGLTGNLTIPNTVKSIATRAFSYCSGFSSLSIPNSITVIEDAVFLNCSGLTGNLNIPNTITTIGNNAFSSCSGLTGNLVIPSSVTSIGNSTFYGCTGLTGNLSIPSSITSIGNNSFNSCIGISEIKVAQIVPLILEAGTFYNINKTTCQLIVPYGTTAAYRAANDWKDFVNITELIYVAFNSQGGTPIADLNPSYNSTISEPIAPTRAGYTFGGWYKESGCINAWNFYTDVVTTNTTLYAKWTINVYTVTFNSQGGSAVSSVNANYNTTIATPTAPTRTGYTFGGWYKEAACTNAWVFATDVVTAATTLYARWTINSYAVTFNSQGGSAVSSVNANYNTTIATPTAPTRTGYTFGGWYKEAACTNAWVFTTDVVTAATTLYARWTINSYAVTFNSQGGSAVSSVNANYNTTIATPTAPTRTGYTFGGWYKEAACTNAWVFATDVVTAATTLYARWTINSYAVTFNSQGGSAVSSVNANYNTTIATPTAPTRTGYTFGGWYKEAACTNAWVFATDVVTAATTLYARWTINSYAVTFNSQGGSAVSSVNANYNTTIATPTAPTRTGYTFGGWYKEAACINAWVFATDVVTAATTLYARWTINSCAVTFNSQGGSAVSSVNANYNTTIATPTAPTRTGYTFGGWYKEAACTNAWNFTTDLVAANTTLCAKWTINVYTVTFDSRGGSAVSSINANYNTTIAAPTSPTRIGYTFTGWYKEITCINAWNFSIDVIASNRTLYAKWTINSYTVSFDSQGGSAVAPVDANYNTYISAPAMPTRTGYTFVWWYKEASCTNIWFFTSELVTANRTLYAKWTINSYTVNFDSQGGSAVSSVNTNHNTIITAPTAPTRTGYTFAGWYKEAAYSNIWNFSTDVITDNATLYAKWTINSYTVTFNSQGGTSVASVNAQYGTTIAAPSSPTKTGYTFAGWYKESACTNAWTYTTDWVSGNLTLYAKWTINSYTVTFDSQGGSTVSSISANYNTTIAIPTAPTRTGYTFAGWYKEAECTNSWNFSADLIIASSTLYAKWNVNSYSVNFYTNGGSSVSGIITSYNSTIVAPAAPTQTGYTFVGWYKEGSLTNLWNFSTDRVTDNIFLHAKWTKNTYTVTFNSNGGSSVTSILAVYNTVISAPAEPTKTGCNFVGWYTDAALTSYYSFGFDPILGNTTLYAKWEPKRYSVQFNAQGGSSVGFVYADYNTTISEPIATQKLGYTFKGWYKESGCINPWNFASDVVTSSITLYAKWAINIYTVHFNTNGGSAIADIQAVHNTTIAEPTPPTRTGYSFTAWFEESTLEWKWRFDAFTITQDTTLYASWEINTYNISFDTQGGSAISGTSAVYGTKLTEPALPTKEGYTFGGWYKEISCTNRWTFNVDVVAGSATLYAKWTVNTYTISFYTYGGSSVASISATYNTKITAPTQPTKTGYTFAGWYQDAAYSSTWNFDVELVTADRTLYAKWTINSYTVTFDSQGGSEVASVSANHNATITAPVPPTRTGHAFGGWYKDAAYTIQWSFSNDVVTANMTLYAKWSIISYTVSFDSQGGSSVATVSANYNALITAPTPPTKTNSAFAGWFKEAACINPWVFTSDLVVANTTLYAKWSSTISIATIASREFNMYPNPAKDQVKLEGKNIQQLTIYNLAGLKMMQLTLTGNESASFDVSELNKGIYLIYVKTKDQEVAILKLIKN